MFAEAQLDDRRAGQILPVLHAHAEGAVAVGAHFSNLEELRQALQEFRERYNEHWLIERNGSRSPRQVRGTFLFSEPPRDYTLASIQSPRCGTEGRSAES
jgi:hypothetical protein